MTTSWILAAGGAAGLALLWASASWHHGTRATTTRMTATTAGWLCLVASLILFDYSVPDLVNSYVWQIIVKVGIYITLAVSLNIINGIAGQFSMGHAGFMAVGAYTTAYLTMTLGAGCQGWVRWLPWNEPWASIAGSPWLASLPWSLGNNLLFLLALIAGGIAAAIAGTIVGIPSLRLKGDYLAIVTLGFGEIIRNLIANVEIIGASRGLPAVPHYTNLFWVFFFAALAIFVSYRLLASWPGRAMLAVREDEVAAAAMGIDTTRTKIQAFVLGTFFAGIAGGLLAHHQEYLHPDYFKFDKSFEVIIMVVLGGMGSVSGAAIAAVVLAIAPEALRYVKDLLGNLTEPAVLYALVPFILFAALFLVLFASDTLRMLWRGGRGLVLAMRVRTGRALGHAEIAKLRERAPRPLTSFLPELIGSSLLRRDAGLGALAGLTLVVLHREFLGTGWDPRLEYFGFCAAGALAGAYFARRRGAVVPMKPERTDSTTSPGAPEATLWGRRLALVGLLAFPAFALAFILENGAPAFVDRVSVFFQAFPDPRMVLYSLMLIVLMLTRPQGLFGTSEVREWWRQKRRGAGRIS